MRIYNTQEEFDAEVKNGLFKVNDHVKFNFCLVADCDIKANNIDARNIKAFGIKADNIDARNIKAFDIKADKIKAFDIIADDIIANNIDARNIKADDIIANNIDARNIKAFGIKAGNISYYAYCVSYNSIECKEIKGRRKNSFHKCLDGKLTIKPKTYKITIDNKEIELSEESYQSFKKQFND